jgi:hypothetical protein
MRGPECLAEEALGGLGIARLTEQKVDGLAGRINGPVEVIPRLLDFNVGLIDAVRVIRLGKMRAAPLVEFRRIALHPAKHCRMIDGAPALLHQFFDITVAEGVAEIPPHAADDDLTSTVTPFEERGLIHTRSPVI